MMSEFQMTIGGDASRGTRSFGVENGTGRLLGFTELQTLNIAKI